MQKIGVHNNNSNSDNDDDDDDDDNNNNITPSHKLHWFNTEAHDWDSGYRKKFEQEKLSPYSVEWYQFTVLIL